MIWTLPRASSHTGLILIAHQPWRTLRMPLRPPPPQHHCNQTPHPIFVATMTQRPWASQCIPIHPKTLCGLLFSLSPRIHVLQDLNDYRCVALKSESHEAWSYPNSSQPQPPHLLDTLRSDSSIDSVKWFKSLPISYCFFFFQNKDV